METYGRDRDRYGVRTRMMERDMVREGVVEVHIARERDIDRGIEKEREKDGEGDGEVVREKDRLRLIMIQ